MTAASPSPRSYLVAADPWSRVWAYDGGRRLAYGSAAHAHGELALVAEGDVTYVIGRRIVHASAGQLVWVPPGVEHRTSFGPRVHALALGIPLAADELAACRLADAQVWSGRPALQALVRAIAEPSRRGDTDARLAVAAARDGLVASLADSPDRGGGAQVPHGIRRAIDRIHAELGEPLAIETLAATAGLSRFHFSRVFRDATGQSPYQYLLEARLDAALALVRTTRASMTDIALACGFTDASRFAQLFRRRYAATPGAVRAGSARTSHGPRARAV